jgi:hypothetical protein
MVVLSEGIVEKTNRWGTTYLEDPEGVIVIKVCTKCCEYVDISEFNIGKRGLGGRLPECKACRRRASLAWRGENPEKKYAYDQSREYNAEKKSEYNRKWREGNQDTRNVQHQRRRARKATLPDTLTTSQWERIVAHFGGCALTGSTEYVQEHAIPLAAGYGGTVFENMSPMRPDLNASKGARHLFEWFEWARDKYNLSQRKFDELIAYLAEVNEMTPKEYRIYTDWCFDNPVKIGVTE